MIAPRVHTGGTSYQELFNQYMSMLEDLQRAVCKLEQLEVHDRDYYPMGAYMGRLARQDKQRMFTQLRAIEGEIEKVLFDIQKQEPPARS